MTHKEFIVCMEENEAGRAIFQKYRTLYKKWRQPVLAEEETHRTFINEGSDEYLPIMEKLMQTYSEYIKKLADFVHVPEGEFLKVINYLEGENADL